MVPRVMPSARVILTPLVLVVALVFAASAHTMAGAGVASPFPLSDSSLSQQGQDLVWSATLAHAFSADGLRTQKRSLCLVIERSAIGSVAGRLCVVPGRHGMALSYANVALSGQQGPGHLIDAAITRSGPEEVTASFLPSQIGAKYRPLHWQTQSALVSAVGTLTAVFPQKPALAKLHTPQLVGCAPAGPSTVFAGSPAVHQIALTFDDGPWGDPPSIDFVDLLARYHVPATFFEIGDQLATYDPTGAVERRMLADGDMIGDHTWTHPMMTGLSPAAQTSELQLTAEAIHRRTGFTPCLWRPPYGDISPELTSLARSLGFLTIMWDVDPRDWSLPGVGAIEANVLGNAHNGAIVIQHFGGGPRFETLAALPDEITTLRARGYRFVTVAQLLGLRLIYK